MLLIESALNHYGRVIEQSLYCVPLNNRLEFAVKTIVFQILMWLRQRTLEEFIEESTIKHRSIIFENLSPLQIFYKWTNIISEVKKFPINLKHVFLKFVRILLYIDHIVRVDSCDNQMIHFLLYHFSLRLAIAQVDARTTLLIFFR